MSQFDRRGLLEYFLLEAEDHINAIHRGLSELETSGADHSVMEDLFRSAHTLKGSAALVKLGVLSSIAHRMEDIFEEIKDGKRPAAKEVVDLLSFMLEAIKSIILDINAGKPENPDREREVIVHSRRVLAEKPKPPSAPPPAVPAEQPSPKTSAQAMAERREIRGKRREDYEFFSGNLVKVDYPKIEEMLNLIGEITIGKNYMMRRIRETGDISDEIFFAGRRLIREVSDFSARYEYSLPENVSYVDPLLSEFGELEFDQYDELNLFSRKLQEITSDINEALKGLSEFFDGFSDDMRKLDSMTNMLRARISETRMVEIGRLFQRFTGPIRDMASRSGKQVELLISGGDITIDKIIFERLFDPIMHIVRNAVAHGLETPEERKNRGKKAEGSITMSAAREGNSVVIEIRDDGRGINTGMLYAKAVEKGLMKSTDTPSRDELLSLIFLPGFSTAVSADLSSGRGMGMNAVRKMISSINGVLDIDTASDAGAGFRIRVPMSLAITNVVVFRCGGMEMVMPSNFIEEIIQYDPSVSGTSTPRTVVSRGRELEVKSLAAVLQAQAEDMHTVKNIIVCGVSNKSACLLVDEIVGQEETIIKPMNKFLAGVAEFSGTTISGDGRIRLVANPLRIFEHEILPVGEAAGEKYVPERRVLVVDDSLSVRKYLGMFLEARDFEVLSASNGVEAMNVLENGPVDMIITDLEMPVMHGYELISRIRKAPGLGEIPIVVLTSRSAEKHVEKARRMGADDYLVKPFDEKAFSGILKKYFAALT